MLIRNDQANGTVERQEKQFVLQNRRHSQSRGLEDVVVSFRNVGF